MPLTETTYNMYLLLRKQKGSFVSVIDLYECVKHKGIVNNKLNKSQKKTLTVYMSQINKELKKKGMEHLTKKCFNYSRTISHYKLNKN